LNLRRYAEAEKFYSRAIRLSPDWRFLYIDKSILYLNWKGDITAARQVLNDALEKNERWPEITIAEIELNVIAQNYDRALSGLSESSEIIEFFDDSASYYNLKGDIYKYLNRVYDMKACYDSARVILERFVRIESNNPFYHARLGLIYAGLGRGQEAIREGKLALDIMPLSRHAVDGAEIAEYFTKILVFTNEFDQAIDQLDYLLSVPSKISIHLLQISPEYIPLHAHPRFQALIEKYKKKE